MSSRQPWIRGLNRLRAAVAYGSLAVLVACGGGERTGPANSPPSGGGPVDVSATSAGGTNCGSGLPQEKFDLNGDGKSDLLWYSAASGQTSTWLMNGTAYAGAASLLVDPNFKVIGTPDLNGDGKCDLLWYNAATGQTAAWLMNGATIIGAAILLTDPNFKVIATPDLNGDGKSDLLWYNAATGQTAAWLMNGTSYIGAGVLLTHPYFRVIATPDLNGDGKADLLWYNAATGQTAAWLMNGTSYTGASVLLTHPTFRVIATPDLDGDGKSDLLWYNAATGQTSAWLMNGTSYTNATVLLTHPDFKVIATPDLNGDGKSDLLWYNAATGQTSAWLMNGTSYIGAALLLTHPDFKVIATPDLNGDGMQDLLWYNAATGQTAAWLMNGTSYVGAAVLLTHPYFNAVVGGAMSRLNAAPVADAGSDQVVLSGAMVQLNGGASSDPDGDALTYAWTLSRPAGSAASLGNPNSVSPTFRPDVVGAYVATLMVSDGQSSSAARSVTVTVTTSGAVGPFSVSGTIFASELSTVDSDTNDPLQTGRASNNTLQTAQASGNPALIVGYVNQPGTSPAGSNLAAGDLWDVYTADLSAGQVVELNFGNASVADLDLFIVDAAGNLVGQSVGVQRSECVLVRRTGRFYIGVLAYSGASAYELGWGSPRPSSTCPNVTPTSVEADSFVVGDIVVKPHPTTAGALDTRTMTLVRGSGLRVKAASASDAPALLQLPSSAAVRATTLQRLRTAGAIGPQAMKSASVAAVGAPGGLSDAGRAAFDTVIAVKLLRASGQFAYAELNFIEEATQVGYGAWPPNDASLARQPHLGLIQLPQAFDALNGMSPRPSYTPIVAVIDTGIVADHPDIARMLVAGYDFVFDPTSGGDGNGIDPNPDDANLQTSSNVFHGTHVAGTIAAESFNTEGVVGVAPMARIMPVRVLGANGRGTSYDIVQGIRFAAGLSNDSGNVPARRADVINMSLGGAGSCPAVYADAIAQARGQGTIVVAAAGNDGGAPVGRPANCPGAIAVSAIAYDGSLAAYSNFGPEVALTAPGGDSSRASPAGADVIYSLSAAFVTDASGVTRRQPTYRGLQGTSMATPHVAGVLALMRAVNPAISPSTIDGLIASGALTDDVGAAGRDNQFGYGRINALKAVLATGSSSTVLPTMHVSPALLDFGSSLTQVSILATRVNGSTDTVSQYVSRSLNPLAIQLFAPAGGNPPAGPYTFIVTLDRTLLAPGENVVRVELLTQLGRRYPFDVLVTPRQVFAPSQRGVGPLYVIALDADNSSSPTLVTALSQSQTPTYSYTMSGIRAPRVVIVAGPDLDNDGFICGYSEPCGAFGTLDSPGVLTLTGNRIGINFSIVSGSTSAAAAPPGRRPSAGYPRGP